jgi:hypothetical protein
MAAENMRVGEKELPLFPLGMLSAVVDNENNYYSFSHVKEDFPRESGQTLRIGDQKKWPHAAS